MSLDGAGSITDWNPYIYDIAFAIQKDFTYGYKNQLYSKRNLPPFSGTRKRRNAFGLSGGRQMGASGRMNMSEKMLEL